VVSLPAVRFRAESALRLVLVITMLWALGPVQAAGRDLCAQSGPVRIWTAPRTPASGASFKVLAVATDGHLSGLRVRDPTGTLRLLPASAGGGPPWSLAAAVLDARPGTYRIEAERAGQVVACREVAADGGPGGDFPLRRWDASAEALYSAWIERLFEAPPSGALSFASLHPGEDGDLPATPDCADLPYFLRTYFAWKLGLPMAFRACSRGSATSAPRCGAPLIEEGFIRAPASASAFTLHRPSIARRVMDTVHSGSARTGLTDESTDFYPVPLTRSALRPGTSSPIPTVTSWCS